MTRQEFGDAYEDGGYLRTVRLLQKRGIGRDQAREIAQAAWVKGLERLYQLRDENVLVEWVNTIARRELATSFRQPRLAALSEVGSEVSTASSISLSDIELRLALAKCTVRQQQLLTAFYWDGHSTHELAMQTGRSLEAIHAELYRARQELRANMQASRRQVTPTESVSRMKVRKEDAAPSEVASAA